MASCFLSVCYNTYGYGTVRSTVRRGVAHVSAFFMDLLCANIIDIRSENTMDELIMKHKEITSFHNLFVRSSSRFSDRLPASPQGRHSPKVPSRASTPTRPWNLDKRTAELSNCTVLGRKDRKIRTRARTYRPLAFPICNNDAHTGRYLATHYLQSHRTVP